MLTMQQSLTLDCTQELLLKSAMKMRIADPAVRRIVKQKILVGDYEVHEKSARLQFQHGAYRHRFLIFP